MTKQPQTLAIIPVRLSSTRLPNKPLADICGKTLIQRVWEQACMAKCFSSVIVATEDKEIAQTALDFGATVVVTSTNPRTGTDRVAEALTILGQDSVKYDLIANVQGDMPFINPLAIEQAVEKLRAASPEIGMSTIATAITSEDEYSKSSAVKVVVGVDGRALYFSRSPIPHYRDGAPAKGSVLGLKHIGLYVFKRDTLHRVANLPPAPLEQCEKLEQLRALEHGVQITVAQIVPSLLTRQVEVDTPADLAKAREIARLSA